MSRLLLALSFFAVACDSSSNDEDPACSVDQGSTCVEYYGDDAEDSFCASAATSSESCSMDQLVAVCTVDAEGTDLELMYFLYEDGYDDASAEAFCSMAGGELE